MPKAKANIPKRTNTQVREMLLTYFYERNANATSARGKKGTAVKIRDVKQELKASRASRNRRCKAISLT